MGNFIDAAITTITTPNEEDVLKKILTELAKYSVYVGIPESDEQRKAGEMTNAALLHIHTNGSPVMNIPARPVLEPAIEEPNNSKKLSAQLIQVALSSFNNDRAGVTTNLEKTGMLAQNICRDWFEDPANGWPPNQPATVKRKLSRLKGKKRKEAIEAYKAGSSVDQPLIDTGEMRKSITYVVETK